MTITRMDRIGLYLRALGTLPTNHVIITAEQPPTLCWRLDTDSTLARCTLPRWHAGRCTWSKMLM